jgi:hypothetical protein
MVSSMGQLFDFVNKLQFNFFEDFRIKEHLVLVFLKKIKIKKPLVFGKTLKESMGVMKELANNQLVYRGLFD